MLSVSAILVDAGVQVIGGNAHAITYRDGPRPVTAEVRKYDELPLSLPPATLAPRLLVACVTASTRARLKALDREDVDLVIDTPREVVLSGRIYADARRRLPRGDVAGDRWRAIERMLILADRRLPQREIADTLHVSQQAVSRIVRYRNLPAAPLASSVRAALLESWLAGYRPLYEETYWYGLAPIGEQVGRVVSSVRELGVAGYAGGEVAADRIRPWRVPAVGLVYCDELLDLTDADLVVAGADDATLALRVSGDPTVSATSRWWWNEMGSSAYTVDPVIALWDLRVGRSDPGDGAEEELYDWICRAGGHRLDIAR